MENDIQFVQSFWFAELEVCFFGLPKEFQDNDKINPLQILSLIIQSE